jgi:hypothetical protein
MLQLSVNCFNCRKSLEDDKVLLDDLPSVKTKVISEGGEGYVYLSSTYGNFHVKTDIPLKDGEVVEFYCPYCGESLKTTENCEVCFAPMIRVDIDAGGRIDFCARKGCENHHIEFADFSKDLRSFLAQYSGLTVPFPREDGESGNNMNDD